MNAHLCPGLRGLPPFPQLWARWTVTAAAFAAVRRPQGPRVLPLIGWFENRHGGVAVLHVLPGGRAALWGEVTSVAAGRAAVFPFDYRWEYDRWRQVQPVVCDHHYAALPDIWSTNETVDIVTELLGVNDEQRRAAIVSILCATEIGTVTRSLITDAFDNSGCVDTENAIRQFAMAGALAGEDLRTGPPRLSAGRVCSV